MRRMYTITMGSARCAVGMQLASKYSMAQENEQTVVSVTNNVRCPAWQGAKAAMPYALRTCMHAVALRAASHAPSDFWRSCMRFTHREKPGGCRHDTQSQMCPLHGRRMCRTQVTLEQTWFNEARTRKPQTFKPDPAAAAASVQRGFADPTDGGSRCDFCRWPELTAQDAWGRMEARHAVTGSNLFKYGEPYHGLVLFKHHDPLEFT